MIGPSPSPRTPRHAGRSRRPWHPRITRTFSMLGADGAGKTALVEALLRLADAKRASPDGSSSRLDAEPEEKKRNFTLSLHPETFEEGGRSFHVLDCPGLRRLPHRGRVGAAGDRRRGAGHLGGRRRPQPGRADLRRAGRLGPPRHRGRRPLDHEQADFQQALADIEASLKVKPVPVQLPIGAGAPAAARGSSTCSP